MISFSLTGPPDVGLAYDVLIRHSEATSMNADDVEAS